MAGFYRLWHRVEREFAVVSGDSADDACRSIGWRVGDVWVRPLRNPTIAEIEEERRLLESVSPPQDDRQGERGQMLLETALVLPLLCALIVGGLCLAMLISDRSQLAYASSQAAIWAVIPGNDAALACEQVAANTLYLGTPAAVVCAVVVALDRVTVRLEYPQDVMMFGPLTLRGEATAYR
jgi:hypothetical protein